MAIDSPSLQLTPADQSRLIAGEILLDSRLYSLWGGSVTAQMYLALDRSLLWAYLTDYDRWTKLFAHITQSYVLETRSPFHKRLYQAAQKKFPLITLTMDAHLWVREYAPRRIWFELERQNASFREFNAELWLEPTQDGQGTFFSYTVQGIATLPIPAPLLQEAIASDLPHNLRHLRSYVEQLKSGYTSQG